MEDKMEEHVSSLAADLRELVAEIEGKPATTQGHYARYMSIISATCDSETIARIMRLALLRAGANSQGVSSAMKICGFAG